MNSKRGHRALGFVAAAVGLAGLLVASGANAQSYAFTHLAGSLGCCGYVDGQGSAARFSSPWDVTMDANGNFYVADSGNRVIRKITPDAVVTTFAGTAGSYGSANGTGSTARFSSPGGIAVDGTGNLYVADSSNHTIRKITPEAVVTTLAGLAGSSGSVDGTGTAARFSYPNGIGVDTSGNVYVSESGNSTIRKVTPGGVVTTLAGLAGSSGSADGTGSGARFFNPYGLAVDTSGNVYVADTLNYTIRKVTPGGAVTTIAGLARSSGWSDGTGSAARFNWPAGLVVDGSGNVYVGDTDNHTIRMITPGGAVSTLAGSATFKGWVDGNGSTARFTHPQGMVLDGQGNLYLADYENCAIRKMTPGRDVTTFAGLPLNVGSADGNGAAAQFNDPNGVAVDKSGNVYVADTDNYTIRKITPQGAVTTLAGLAKSLGSANGTGTAARFWSPPALAVDGDGNVYVADQYNETIRKITPSGVTTTLAGSAGQSGSTDGAGTAARFFYPAGVAVDGSGNVYVSDNQNNTIRKVTSGGAVTTLAGLAGSSGSADGTGSAAQFAHPRGLAVDGSGTVYVADRDNHTIRKITAGGVVSTLAGLAGSLGTADGTGTLARFYNPYSVAVDGSGNVFVADTYNYMIRKVTSGGVVTTIGGKPNSPGNVDGVGSDARFSLPAAIAVDGSGNLYIADSGNQAIRKGAAAGLVLTQSRVQVIVEWRSQYSGQSGTAFPIPQQDGFGFFYFTDPGNPEVFVKVLDFGGGGALCFVGGLSDFYYKVTFTTIRTGQNLVFEKAAGAYVGFADNGTLRFGRPGEVAPQAAPQLPPGAAFSYAGFLPFGPEGRVVAARHPALSLAQAAVAPQSLTLSQGRVQVIVEWRSQYSGQSGVAYGIPQQDGFGFFYFTDSGNPEVFVKVLDFGQGGALCFVGGLSDFYYKVTFKTLRTGQTLVFEKAAGLYVGFADNGTLRF